jgi:hypothetical protein
MVLPAKLGTSMEEILDQLPEEKWETGADNDAHLVRRESTPAKVRERWAQTRLLIHQKTLERELAVAHISEHLDESLPFASLPPKPLSWWDNLIENLGVRFCQAFHRAPHYRRGDQFYECACGRKYALPWSDVSKLDTDVYVPTTAFIKPATPTLQAVCRNGWMGEV